MRALKCVNLAKLNRKLEENIETEIAILTSAAHANIVKLFQAFRQEGHMYIVMEYCEAGDLAALIRRRRSLPEPVARNLTSQLVSNELFGREAGFMGVGIGTWVSARAQLYSP